MTTTTYSEGDRVYVTGLPGVYGIDPTIQATVHRSDGPRIRVQVDGSDHFLDCLPEWLTPVGGPYPEEILGEYDDDGTMPESLEALREAVIGSRIASVEQTTQETFGWPEPCTIITLDNGHRVKLVGSSDCCAFTEVSEFLLHPDKVDHAILGVGTTGHYTTWHIYADHGDILELTVGWSPGNPFWYGYGFSIQVEEIS